MGHSIPMDRINELERRTTLSARQAEVAALLEKGLSYGEAADALGIDRGTVSSHAHRIREKHGEAYNTHRLLEPILGNVFEIYEAFEAAGQGARVTIHLDGMTVPTEPYDGYRYAHEDTDETTIRGRLALVEDDGEVLDVWVEPDQESIERVGLDRAAAHPDTDSDPDNSDLGLVVGGLDLMDSRPPTLTMRVPTGGEWAERYDDLQHHDKLPGVYAGAASPPAHELGTIVAVEPE